MCGVAGCWQPNGTAGTLDAHVQRMTATLVHRGPDAGDSWMLPDHGLALGFRRLAVVDVSPTGMQPMHSHSGRYTVVYNGEIYNHRALRAQLDPLAWRGTSDTEVLLAAFDRWGIDGTLPRLQGMFAIAVWDHQQHTLTLVRDRRGEKPLYYGLHGDTLLFASELKALCAHPAFQARIDRCALAAFMYASFVPSPSCIWQSTHKLPAAGILTITAADITSGRLPAPHQYWQLPTRNPLGIGDFDAVERLDSLLRDVIRQQLLADVPVGAFLSGGVDSSTVVALSQAVSAQAVKTYTIGIPEDAGLDESIHAEAVARHLGTNHHSLAVSHADARELIPGLGTMYDEPFADASQIPTHLVARLARESVTVALSGDGGDELFGGYRRYVLAPRVARRARHVPAWLAGGGRRLLQSISASTYDRIRPGLGDSLHQASQLLGCRSVDDVYVNVFGAGTRHQLVANEPFDARRLFETVAPAPRADEHPLDRMMRLDGAVYIPDDICVKVDRAAMAVSLETRMPFLDHEIAEFAWSLPHDLLIRDDVSKWVLRQVLARYVPPSLTDRPKAGFGLPIAAWMRGPLRGWIDDMLSTDSLAHGLFDTPQLQRLWRQHRAGRHNHTRLLWNALMFQEWYMVQSPAGPQA